MKLGNKTYSNWQDFKTPSSKIDVKQKVKSKGSLPSLERQFSFADCKQRFEQGTLKQYKAKNAENQTKNIAESEKHDKDNFLLNMESKRLETFKNWPFKENANKMAEAGFYFCPMKGYPDLVKCFACHKELDEWKKDDDPWEEHRLHSSECPFVKLNKPESMITVEEFLNLECERQILRLRADLVLKKEKFIASMKSIEKQLKT